MTVSLTVDLDASGGINALEEPIVEQGRAVRQQLVRQAVQQDEAEQGACPQGGQMALRRGGSQRRVLLTRFGRVALVEWRWSSGAGRVALVEWRCGCSGAGAGGAAGASGQPTAVCANWAGAL